MGAFSLIVVINLLNRYTMSLNPCIIRNVFRSARMVAKKSPIVIHCQTSLYARQLSLSQYSLGSRLFTESHEWIVLSDDKATATIGISDHAQSALGDVVFVELPEEGKELGVGDECGLVESTKSVSSIYSPVSGIVSEGNTALEENPGSINKSPYDEGWICKVKVTDNVNSELENLMSEESYDKFLGDQNA